MASVLKFWPLALIAVSGLTGWLAWDQYRDRLVAQGRAEVYAARADSLRGVVEAEEAAQERADSLAAAAQARASRERERADSVVEVARARRPEIVERIVHAPDTTAIRQAVEELEIEHATEVSALRQAMATQDSVIHAQAGQIEVRNAALRVRDALIASLEAAQSETRGRGSIETWSERALWGLAGAAVGYLASRVP